jgi:UDP-GlcNAc:undecaprenyl-phosphate GlcNAc-1-phosphate transferase
VSTVGLISFLIAISLSMMLIPLLVRVAPSLGLEDAPGPRKVHTDIIPRVGGIAIFFGCMVPLLIWMPGSELSYSLLLALIILFVFGVWDDISDISFRIKFFGQIAAAAVVVYWGDSGIHNFPFVDDYAIPEFPAKILQ